MAMPATNELKTHGEYTVGWICALPKEQTAATAMLDQRHGTLPKPANDSNTYTLGSIGKYNVAIACLPKGHIGNNSAATVAAQMVTTFPSIRFGLMVGIGGGIPPKVRLGDVVVSTPVGGFPGVVQWDFGKANYCGFERTGSLNNPPASLLTAITTLETEHELVGSKIPEYLDELKRRWPLLASRYLKSDSMRDVLFKAEYSHVGQRAGRDITSSIDFEMDTEEDEEESCRFCNKTNVVRRKPRDMRVHYGLIASGNQAIKSAAYRDQLNKDLGGNLLCVEMEAAGLMNNFPCVVIRGICDYADSHKNKDWQEYAAAVAAAFAKELLNHVQPSDVHGESTVKDMLGDVLTSVSTTRVDVSYIRSNLDNLKDLQVLDWITPIDYGPQQSDFFKRRQPGTGQWLLDSTEYQAWLGARKKTLFCPGIPGAGKTILTSIAINHLEKTFRASAATGIAYIYCNYRRQEEQGVDNLLASLLKQLSRRRSRLPDCVMDVYSEHKNNGTRPPRDEIQTALKSVAKMYSSVFIIVDALDECRYSDGCRQYFLTELFHLQENCEVNLFLTSRFILEIVNRFKTGSVSLEIRASAEDIQTYLKGHTSRLPTFVQKNQELQQEIVTGISEAVDGMFLLAEIYLDSLSDKITPKAIKKALKYFHRSILGRYGANRTAALRDAYEQAMQRINGQQPGFRELANKVLMWIVCAERQLTKTELQHAIAVEVDESKLDEENLPSTDDMVSVCAGLVTVDDESNIIRLVHYTTQEYFKDTCQRWFLDAEITITETCISYLLFKDFEGGPCQTDDEFVERLKLHPLYNYAAQNWGHHARKASKLSPKVLEFLECEAQMGASTETLKFRDDYSNIWNAGGQRVAQMTSLHLAAYFGIEEVVKVLLEKTTDINSEDDYWHTPLSWAAYNGHDAVVKLLLTIPDVDSNYSAGSYGIPPLSWAARNGHESVVRLLLAVPGVNVNSRGNHSFFTPLILAIQYSHEEVVELLLAVSSIDVNASGGYNPVTPLSVATANGNGAVVKLLIEVPEIEVNRKDDTTGLTVLSQAVKRGDEAIVKLLLSVPNIDVNSCDPFLSNTPLMLATEGRDATLVKLLLTMTDIRIDYQDTSWWTPLWKAVDCGDEAVVKLLLAAGADPNKKERNEGTPLIHAARHGFGAIVKLLLEAGAGRDQSNNCGRTPLWEAAFYGHENVIQLLLEAGADPDIKDDRGRTPLSVAELERNDKAVKLLSTGIDIKNADEDSRVGLVTSAGMKRKREDKKME